MQVDFYILDDAEDAAVRQFACRLTEKAYLRGHSVHVQLRDEGSLALMDEQLWTFRDGSFVPHDRVTSTEPTTTPVTLATDAQACRSADVVLLVDCELPVASTEPTRLAEIVSAEEGARQRSRERFKRYKSQGLEPTIHKISTRA